MINSKVPGLAEHIRQRIPQRRFGELRDMDGASLLRASEEMIAEQGCWADHATVHRWSLKYAATMDAFGAGQDLLATVVRDFVPTVLPTARAAPQGTASVEARSHATAEMGVRSLVCDQPVVPA